MATLADVARRAGVSPATVSRVVSGSERKVTEELRIRVLKAVADLHYVPNAHAQLLARSHRTAVGVIVHDVSDPYFAEITRGLQRVATDHGRLLIICNSYRDPDRERAAVLSEAKRPLHPGGNAVCVPGRQNSLPVRHGIVLHRDEHFQVAADDLGGGISEQGTDALIAGKDGPVPIDDKGRHLQQIESSEKIQALRIHERLHDEY